MNSPIPMRSGSVRSRLSISAKFASGGGEHDEHAAHELHTYIHNDGDLHRQQHHPIIKNLMHKKARGIYDSGKAHKLFGYLADNGAQKYHKEHGDPSTPWHHAFSPKTRHEVARRLRDDFEGEAKLGNYDHLVPKKYQGKPIKHSDVDDGALIVMLKSEGEKFAAGANQEFLAHHEALLAHGYKHVVSANNAHHYEHPDGYSASIYGRKDEREPHTWVGYKGDDRSKVRSHTNRKSLGEHLNELHGGGGEKHSASSTADVERFGNKGPLSGHFDGLTFSQHAREHDYHHSMIRQHQDRQHSPQPGWKGDDHVKASIYHETMKAAHGEAMHAVANEKEAASAKSEDARKWHSDKAAEHRANAVRHLSAAKKAPKQYVGVGGHRVVHPALGNSKE